MTELVYCLTVAFKMTERADHDNAPAILQFSCRLFFAKHHITQVCQPPSSPDLAPREFWLFPKLKSPLKGRRFPNTRVTQHTSPVNGVRLQRCLHPSSEENYRICRKLNSSALESDSHFTPCSKVCRTVTESTGNHS